MNMSNERIATQKERMLSVFTHVERCQREIEDYRCGEPSNEAFGLELLRRAIVQGDQDARAKSHGCMLSGYHPRLCDVERSDAHRGGAGSDRACDGLLREGFSTRLI
jgi:hypothetical protein